MTANLAPDDVRGFVNLEVHQPAISKSYVASKNICQRKAFYEYHLRLTSSQYAKAPNVGTLFHEAMAGYYDGLDTPAVHRRIDAAIDRINYELAGAAATGTEFDVVTTICNELDADSAVAKVMAELFNDKYLLDRRLYDVYPAELKLEYTVPADHAWAPGRNSFRVTARVDRPLLNKKLNGLFILDFKTTGKSPALFQPSYQESFEAGLSRVIVEAADLGYPVLGFLLGVMKKPSIKLKYRTTTAYNKWYRPDDLKNFGPQTFVEYLAEVRDWYAGTGFHAAKKDERTLDPPMTMWVSKYRGRAMTPAVHRHLVGASKLSIKAPTLSNFPETGEPAGFCRNLFGRECPWRPLCTHHVTDWNSIIKKNYKVRPTSEPDVPKLLADHCGEQT